MQKYFSVGFCGEILEKEDAISADNPSNVEFFIIRSAPILVN